MSSNANAAGGGAAAPVEERRVRVIFFGDNHASKLCSIGISEGIIGLLSQTPVTSFLLVSESNGIHKCYSDIGLPPSRILTEFPVGSNPFTQVEFFTVAFIEYSKLFRTGKTMEYWISIMRDPIAFIDKYPALSPSFVKVLQIASMPNAPVAALNEAFILFARAMAASDVVKADPAAVAIWKQVERDSLSITEKPEWAAYTLVHAQRRDTALLEAVKARVLAEPSIDKVIIIFGESHIPNQMTLFDADPLFTVDRTASKTYQESTSFGINVYKKSLASPSPSPSASAASIPAAKKGGRRKKNSRARRTRRARRPRS